MKTKKIFFLFFIIYIFVFSASFQHHRLERYKKPLYRFFRPRIQSINKGLPFQLKEKQYVPDQILIKFKPTLSELLIEITLAAYQTKKINRIPRLNIYQLQIPRDLTVEEMVYIMNQNPDVEYAEPNYIVYIAETPNDFYFQYQYALYNSGQSIGIPGSPQGKARADIKATAAWEETKGEEEVIIAVIDSGVDLLHPDLENKILSSGRDFFNDDFDATDDNGHGTHVAGIAAAESNNNEGIAGVAWNCKILPIKIVDEEGYGDHYSLIEGITYAADNGADVINLSVGGEFPSQILEDVLIYAYEKDIVIVAAVGNEGGAVWYPAAYDDYCLAVAATDYDDIRVDWSNFGPEVDVAAPGERIISLVPTWYPSSIWEDFELPPYGYGFGTSMAAPHVSGFAALIKSVKPWLTAAEIMNIIRYSADDTNKEDYPGNDEFIGYGRINMEKALVPIKITTHK